MAPSPPYVNPLRAEQLEELRLSDIRFEHLQDGSIDADKTAKVAALVRTRLIERLGVKYTAGAGNAVLVVPLQLVFNHRGRPTDVGLRVTGKVVGSKLLAEYPGSYQVTGIDYPRATRFIASLRSPEELVDGLVNAVTADLARQILCCARSVSEKATELTSAAHASLAAAVRGSPLPFHNRSMAAVAASASATGARCESIIFC